MRADLADKEKELEVSRMTSERLKDELAARSAELDKIAGLDARITEELQALEGKTRQMEVRAAMAGASAPSVRPSAVLPLPCAAAVAAG